MKPLPALPRRRVDAHKGDFGRVQVIGGCAEMPGAPALAALAALRSGAGLVQVVCPPQIRPSIAPLVPCATFGVPGRSSRFVPTVRAVGPGWGKEVAPKRLQEILADSSTPLVVDADALNMLARMEQWWTLTRPGVVLTPHPGEMRRLLEEARSRGARAGLRAALLAEQWHAGARLEVTKKVAALCGAVVVLKGHRTVVSDGKVTYVNRTGNPGMATGGSGDVLTGVIAALIGQGLSPHDAACLGVLVHGRAGDLAARKFGQVSMMATDIIDALPGVFGASQK